MNCISGCWGSAVPAPVVATTVVFCSQLIAEIRKLAAENPEARYERSGGGQGSCYYTVGRIINAENVNSGGCIVGQAFQRLLSPSDLGKVQSRDGVGSVSACGILDMLGIRHTWQQGEWLRNIQSRQDNGHTWSYAVRFADAAAVTRALMDA